MQKNFWTDINLLDANISLIVANQPCFLIFSIYETSSMDSYWTERTKGIQQTTNIILFSGYKLIINLVKQAIVNFIIWYRYNIK